MHHRIEVGVKREIKTLKKKNAQEKGKKTAQNRLSFAEKNDSYFYEKRRVKK